MVSRLKLKQDHEVIEMSNLDSNKHSSVKSIEPRKTTKREFKPTYLYVKTHNVTGLKYFGKTVSSDPSLYKGSGKLWRRHIAKHDYDVSTEIIGFFEDEYECKNAAIEFSTKNNIVESKEWANLMHENGIDGGALVYTDEMRETQRIANFNRVKNGTHPWAGDYQKNKVKSGTHHLLGGEIQREHARENNLKRIANGNHHFVGSTVNKQRVANGTNPFVGGSIQRENAKKRIVEIKELLESWRDKMFEEGTHPTQVKKICPFCNREENIALFARYHGDKCKMKNSTQSDFLLEL